MCYRAVIALEEIIDDHLPIRLDLEPVAANELQVVVAGNDIATLLGEIAREFGQIGRVRVQVHIDEFTDLADPDFGQIEIAFAETLDVALMVRRSEASLRVERPCMISADERPRSSSALHQLEGAMSADVVESTDDVVHAADDQDALIENLAGEITSGLRQFGDVTREPPVLEEDRLLLALIYLGIEKVSRGQAIRFLGNVGDFFGLFSQTQQPRRRHPSRPLIAGRLRPGGWKIRARSKVREAFCIQPSFVPKASWLDIFTNAQISSTRHSDARSFPKTCRLIRQQLRKSAYALGSAKDF